MHRSLRSLPKGARIASQASWASSVASSSSSPSRLLSTSAAAAHSPLKSGPAAIGSKLFRSRFHTAAALQSPAPTAPSKAAVVEEIQPAATGLQKWSKYLPKVSRSSLLSSFAFVCMFLNRQVMCALFPFFPFLSLRDRLSALTSRRCFLSARED